MLKLMKRSKEKEMSATLTLNKITAQKGITIAEAASRVADLGWTPSYVQEAMTFPTDYKISKTPRDPMRQVLRSYFPMQEEKDNRVYGALDAALRGDMFRNVEPRWVEWMKLFLAIIPFPEISAARSMAMVGRLAPGEELRTGFTMQMVDELRHSTIQMNLKKWYMENYIDAAIGTFIEYGTTNRDKNKESYAELWHRWIYEDYYRTYMLPLEKYGIKIHHDDVAAAWDRIVKKNYVHKTAQFFTVGWSVNFWRIEAQTEKDFEWFEHKYPGWYAEFGDFWKWHAKLSVPGETNILFNSEVGYVYPHRCWSCMVPCLIREDFVCDEVDGKMYTYCSEGCRWTHKVGFAAEYEGRPTPAMGRFSGRREWEDCYHGWDVADAIKDLGFVRSDGKTLIAQPHLRFDAKDMWTLDDVRGHQLGSPLRGFRALSPIEREVAVADYRKGFKINPCH